MSSRKKNRTTNSLAVRLALLYSSVSAVSLVSVLTVSYFTIQSTLQNRVDQGLLAELAEYNALMTTQDIEVMRDVLEREAASEGAPQVFFRILNGEGIEILATDMSAWPRLELNLDYLREAAEGAVAFETYHHEDRPYPTRILYGNFGPGLVMQIGESTADNVELFQYFRRIFVIATVILIVFSVVAGSYMAHRTVEGIRRVSQTARAIAAGAWDSRVPVSDRQDEIDELASAFNEMVEQVQALIKGLKEVTDDIAHDLRTPIMRMRGSAELALDRAEGHTGQQEMAGNVIEECDRLLGLINTMLAISDTEAGARPISRERVDLSAITEDVCELFRPAAEDKELAMSFEQCPQLMVNGDPQKLKRALAHIVDNAVKYTESGGAIHVACKQQGEKASVIVEDTGVGIPESDLAKVFDRFYRVDQSRSQDGNGLGLSLTRAICRAHGGDVKVQSVFGKGSTIDIILPLAPD